MQTSNFEFKHVGLNASGKPWHMGQHSHPFFEVIVVMSASEKVLVENQTLEAATGDVLFFRPGVAHEEWSVEAKTPLETIFFSLTSNDNFDSFPLKINDTKGRLRMMATWMLNERAHKSPAESSLLMNGYLAAFLAEMKRLVSNKDSPFIESVRELIIKDPAKNHSLESLSKFVGLSKFHFLRKYTELAGISPVSDVRKIRLNFAHNLILTTTEPLKSIAKRAGLKNETTLCRLFQKYYKHSPGQLRY
jgi:AraC-like DNA-binding protein